jgi:diphosphomevalonate decarboxylase
MKKSASAVAHSNIALIKYWGKRDSRLNLPAVGSISVTLKALQTNTRVTFDDALDSDQFFLAGECVTGNKQIRVSKFLDLVRELADFSGYAKVDSENNFPTGAGLASSASAFAALALASTNALGINLPSTELSVLARRGSGSAARSVFSGFAEMKLGELPDGSDAHAYQLKDEKFWDLRIIIAITTEKEKQHSSSDGMENSAKTSPFYNSWIESSQSDLEKMRKAIAEKDIKKLGELSESSCLKMHSVMLSSRPALIYWNKVTMDVILMTEQLRREGIPVYFTIDAGPQVKLLTLPEYQDNITETLKSIPGIKQILTSQPGPGAYLEKQGE